MIYRKKLFETDASLIRLWLILAFALDLFAATLQIENYNVTPESPLATFLSFLNNAFYWRNIQKWFLHNHLQQQLTGVEACN